jgi:hypothetical protein
LQNPCQAVVKVQNPAKTGKLTGKIDSGKWENLLLLGKFTTFGKKDHGEF